MRELLTEVDDCDALAVLPVAECMQGTDGLRTKDTHDNQREKEIYQSPACIYTKHRIRTGL